MSKQHLDRAQIGTGLQQMRRETMTQGMWMNLLMLQTSAECSLLAGSPEHLGGYRMACRVPAVAGEQPVRGFVPEPAPVDTECLQQCRAQHHVAVLASLAAPDVDDHPLTVDVGDLQVGDLRASSAGGIQRHQQDAVKWH